MDNSKKKQSSALSNKAQVSGQTESALDEKGPSAATIQKNIETILALEKQSFQERSGIERIASKVISVAGSPPFIILHVLWFGIWITVNTGVIPAVIPFDPFPFSFLTLVVSLEAIFLTLLVLMTQNRMTKTADRRAHLDLQINMLDEQETTMILRIVQRMADHKGLDAEVNETIKELSEETDVNRVAKTLDEKTGDES
jgi:uncharacterized membrane protein